MSLVVPAHKRARTRPAPPVRIVHMGLGAFSRSHTAWYTAHAADAHEWGIAAYTGRSAYLAEALTAQDGLYTLIERSASGDQAEVIESIVRAHPGDDLDSLFADIAAVTTSIVTLTITEAGYRSGADGAPDLTDPLVVADIAALRTLARGSDPGTLRLQTALGRLVWGLELRRRSHGTPLAVVSCDNLPDNGRHVGRSVVSLARSVLPETAMWCEQNISFVSSSVDRITPRISSQEQVALAARYGDGVPVLTEPFHDWVLAGDFPEGRPAWESSGARFTNELEPWEARKLWLLNGAHTLLACLGLLRGHVDVARAMADPVCRQAVDEFWSEAQRHLPEDLDLHGYRAALIERFTNPGIVHRLSQIVLDTPTKLRLRIAPVAERERRAGRSARGCATVLAAWMVASESGLAPASVSGIEAPAKDNSVAGALTAVSAELAEDFAFVTLIEESVQQLKSLVSW